MTIRDKIKCKLGFHSLKMNYGFMSNVMRKHRGEKVTMKVPGTCKRCGKIKNVKVIVVNLNEKVTVNDEQGET